MKNTKGDSYTAASVMILGVAGGNGLEHIEKERFSSVYGVDVNRDYLDECEKRYTELSGAFETICVDLLNSDLELPFITK